MSGKDFRLVYSPRMSDPLSGRRTYTVEWAHNDGIPEPYERVDVQIGAFDYGMALARSIGKYPIRTTRLDPFFDSYVLHVYRAGPKNDPDVY